MSISRREFFGIAALSGFAGPSATLAGSAIVSGLMPRRHVLAPYDGLEK